jgi:hypothetical protein
MSAPSSPSRCPGTLGRRAFLRTGLAGLGALGLADLFRLEAAGKRTEKPGKSMIVLWLWGGPSHMETFDLKPSSPAEYRGEFRPTRTNVPGIHISEYLPRLARLADRFALIRSLHHDSPGHVNSTHTLMSAYPGEIVETPPFRPKHPDLWAVAQRLLGQKVPGVPAHVAMPYVRYHGSAYLGGGLDPFFVSADPSQPGFTAGALSLPTEEQSRLQGRMSLLQRFDRVRSNLEAAGKGTQDRFTRQAVDLLTSRRTARAFDLAAEPARLRERYGLDAVGQRCLLARRLVEAGVRLVTVDFPCVPGQKAFSWDDHASVWNIFEQMKIRLPVLDRVVSALVEDLAARGLDREVLLVVMGEMSHTPKLSNFKGQPGREHWGRAMSVFFAGGGLPMGQAIGATNSRGEEPSSRPVSPNDLLATWYDYLGVPVETTFPDATGRPLPIIPDGKPLRELL